MDSQGRNPASVSVQGYPGLSRSICPGTGISPPAGDNAAAHLLPARHSERHTQTPPEAGQKDTGRERQKKHKTRAGGYPAGSGKTGRQPSNPPKFSEAVSCGTAGGR